MRFAISRKPRRIISEALLRAADVLPFRALERLRYIREEQRLEARRCKDEATVPDGIRIDYLGFIMVDFFPVEEYDVLANGVSKLFPRFDSTQHPLKTIDEFATTNAKGLTRVGTIR